MRPCASCGQNNPDNADICAHCAARLGAVCPACGKPAHPEMKFCGECGQALTRGSNGQGLPLDLGGLPALQPASPNRPTAEAVGERREVTVVFVDTINFTAAANNLDSEDVYLLIDEAMRALVQVVHRFEGTVDKFTGDGLLALFGAPQTHENDPERAVRAALEMQAAIVPIRERVRNSHGFDFQMRVGIHTGLVVAGDVGSDLHMEYTVIGDTVNLAARLQSAAEPGTVLVSFATYQRTRPLFEYESIPPLALKGFPEPVPAFRPNELRVRPGRVRGLPGLQAPMVGRERNDALDRLRQHFEAVRQTGKARAAFISGEAGLGKSRLVAEFRDALGPELGIGAALYVEGACLAYARARPMWVVAEALRNLSGLSEHAAAEVQREALRGHLSASGLRVDDVLPYLLNLLGLEQGNPALAARLALMDGPMLQHQTHAAFRQLLAAMSKQAPMALVFEDLHWVDPASRDLIEFLLHSAMDLPVLFLLVARDMEGEAALRQLVHAADRHGERKLELRLQPLSPSDGHLLVDRLLRTDGEEAAQVKRDIAERAEGNPFYTEELVRMLIDQGGLEPSETGWHTKSRASTLLRDVPGTLKGLILARYDRLSAATKRTLQTCAVLGRSFPSELITEVSRANAPDIPAHLEELERRRFLVSEPFGDGQGYAFRHALIQEAVYSTLLKRDRQRLHTTVAEAIESGAHWLSDNRTEALGYHYAEGKDPARAVPFLIAAAEHAARRHANETCIQHYRRAIDLQAVGVTAPTDALNRARIGLGQALKFVGRYAEAEACLNAVVTDAPPSPEPARAVLTAEAHRQLADVRLLEGNPDEALRALEAGMAALGQNGNHDHPELWRSIMERMAWVRFRQGSLDEAFALASSATLGIPRDNTDDPTTLANLYNTLGGVFWQQGNIAEAIAYVERSLGLYQALGYAFGMANSYTNLGILYYSRGMWPRAAENFERSDSIRRDAGYLPGRAVNLKNLGLLRLAMGEHERARDVLEKSISISVGLGDDFGRLCAEIGLSHLALAQCRVNDAASHLERALALREAAGEDEQIQLCWTEAWVEAERGHLDSGIEIAARALALAQARGVAETEADCLRILGMLLARAGRWAQSETHLRASSEICASLRDSFRQGQALLELARLHHALIRETGTDSTEWRQKAAESYRQAIELFELLGASHDLSLALSGLTALRAADPANSGPQSDGTQIGNLPDGERRTAALVWLTLSAKPGADPEDAFETLGACLPEIELLAAQEDGRAMRRNDGLTMVFGAPTTHEDDTERAVQVALAIRNRLTDPEGPNAAGLFEARVAVSLGSVVAGDVTAGPETEFVVAGAPMAAARLLAETAPSGRVWVTPDVREAAGRLFRFVGPETIAHGEDYIPAFQLAGWMENPGPARGLRVQSRMVGREGLLEAMRGISTRLHQGDGGLIWIEGEPGIGKSRLMREFSTGVTSQGARVLAGQCSPQRARQAFSLVSSLLAGAFNLKPTDSPETMRAKIAQTLQTWPADIQITQPYLEFLCGLRPGGLEGDRLTNLAPDQLRQQVFVALRRLLKSLADEQPVVVLLDDLHWVDPISAELLVFLTHLTSAAPVLLVCALRHHEVGRLDERIRRAQEMHPDRTLHLRLDRLSLPDAEALLDELLAGTSLPTRVRGLLLERGEGNPYFIEEIVRMLIERGLLRFQEDGWKLDPDLDPATLPLPKSLGALIQSRVDALPADLKRLLQCAAVLGSPFEASLLESISGHPDVELALHHLEARGMIRTAAEAGQWQFHHSLAETAVYNSLLKAHRRTLHLRAAQAMESRWVGDETAHADELAYHYSQAEEGAKALGYMVIAGERAAARYANEEALVYFQNAADQLRSLPETGARLQWRIAAGLGDVYRFVGAYAESATALDAAKPMLQDTSLPPAMHAGLLRRMGETALKQGHSELARDNFDDALRLVRGAEDRESQVEAAQTLTSLAWADFLQGQFESAQAACEAATEYARRAGNLNELGRAENILGGIHHRQGNWDRALSHTTKALGLREQMGYTWGVAASTSNLGILSVAAGEWGKAREYFQKSLALRQDLGDVEGIAIAHNNIASLARDQGEFGWSEHHFRESLAIAVPLGMVYHEANANLGLAQTLLAKGGFEAAFNLLDRCLDVGGKLGAQELLAEAHRLKAEVLMLKSDWVSAAAALDNSLALAAETGNRSLESAALRVLSEYHAQRGDSHAARESIAKAWLALADVTDELEAGRVAAQAGRISLVDGQVAQAQKELDLALEVFSRLGAGHDLRRAEALWQTLPGDSVTELPARERLLRDRGARVAAK